MYKIMKISRIYTHVSNERYVYIRTSYERCQNNDIDFVFSFPCGQVTSHIQLYAYRIISAIQIIFIFKRLIISYTVTQPRSFYKSDITLIRANFTKNIMNLDIQGTFHTSFITCFKFPSLIYQLIIRTEWNTIDI